jgi:hypothetical protein
MQSPLDRLYRTRLALLATIATVVGVALLVLAHWATNHTAGWLHDLPVADIGSALFTTGLIAIFFEYIDQADADTRANERLRKVLSEEAPAIRDAVVDGFAFAPDSLTNVASPQTLDRIVENTLAIRLGDKDLAADAYHDLREQIIGAKQRWYDARVSVALAPWDKGAASGPGAMYVATIAWEYRVVPTSPMLRFACVSDLDGFSELSADPAMTAAWYFEPIGGLTASSPDVFELVQASVNGKQRPARRSTRKDGLTYTVDLGQGAEGEGSLVAISFTYRVLVQQSGHLLHLDLAQPTEDFTAELFYGDCGIRYVNVLDYLSGPRQPRITRLPASGPTPRVSVAYDGWTFPKGGVAFVWVLERELEATKSDQR